MQPRIVLLNAAIVLFTAAGSAHGGSHGSSGSTGTGTGQLVSANVLIPAAGLLFLAAGILLYGLNQAGYLDKFKPRGR